MAGRFDGPQCFVGGLPPTFDDSQLQLLFEPFGGVASVNLLPCNSNTGNRCGFVNFVAMENAQQAVDTLHGKHQIHPGMPAIVVRFRQSKRDHEAGVPRPSAYSSGAAGGYAAAMGTGYSGGGGDGGYPPNYVPRAPEGQSSTLFVGSLPGDANEQEVRQARQERLDHKGHVTTMCLHVIACASM